MRINRDQTMKRLGYHKKMVCGHYYYTKCGNPERDGISVDQFNAKGKRIKHYA